MNRPLDPREAGPAFIDLLIIGAGPAGMAAAIEASEAGLAVLVVDEGSAPGGQVYRNAEGADARLTGPLGPDFVKGRPLIERFLASRSEYVALSTVFMIEREGDRFSVGVASGPSARMIEARNIIIATGAQERPFPIPGWTLPGVLTAGAAQTFLKSSGIVPSGPVVLAGNGPLLVLLAAQYLRLGVRIEALLETTPPGNLVRALPHLPGFFFSPYAWKGLGLLREVFKGCPVHFGVSELAASGAGRLERVSFRHRGQDRSIEASTLLLHQGVVPQVNLAMSAGVPHSWNADRLAFEPRLSAEFESEIPGLFVAGDSAGIGGAEAAQSRGILAANAILGREGRENAGARERIASAQAALARQLRGRAFLDAFYRPAPAFRMPPDNVVICRCEEVKAGEIRQLARQGATGPNQVKAFCRAGMGPCQGRSCSLTVTELIAETSGASPGQVGHMRIRAPVKPVTVGQMAQLSANPGSPPA